MQSVEAVILAAGSSTRLGTNKLFVRIDGQSVIRRSVRAFAEAGVERILVVAGEGQARMAREIEDFSALVVANPSHREGMSSSVRVVMPHLADSAGVLFHLGDKPFVNPDVIREIVRLFREKRCPLVIPRFEGKRGHPVLLDIRRFRDEMTVVTGDEGLRSVVERHLGEASFVGADEGSLMDIDTKADLDELVRKGYVIEED